MTAPRGAYRPLRLAVMWLVGTFLAFLVIGQSGKVSDLFGLTAFVTATVVAFALGYWLSIQSSLRRAGSWHPLPEAHEAARVGDGRTLVLVSGIYLGLFGAAQLLDHGATGPASIIKAVMNPGAAYFTRLRGYDVEAAGAEANPLVQVLTLMAVLATPAVPFLVIYWRRLSIGVRAVGLLGLGTYCAYWAFVGTLKGLGDMFIFACVGILVASHGRGPKVRTPGQRLRRAALVVTLVALFGGYMAYNQSDRLSTAGVTGGFEANPMIASLTNEKFALGVAVTAFYPTHGYLGLSYNLDTPFQWSHGLGSSRALNSYMMQYAGTTDAFPSSYPARTEVLTGWPSGSYWATIYPWIASDLTYPGAVIFMGVVGWWLARLWRETTVQRSRLSMLLFAQLCLLIVYVPANNQLGLTRSSLIAFVSLALLYTLNRLSAGLRRGNVDHAQREMAVHRIALDRPHRSGL